MTQRPELDEILAGWELPAGDKLLDCVERMIRPALLAGYFGKSYTRFVAGLQYHLGGEQDTRELAGLASLSASDHVFDVCCFIGGPALQLAASIGCHVTGVDLDTNAIAAASRIAQVTEFADLLSFKVADACTLPFDSETFTVVWNQCSLESDVRWLKEFDRVLAPGGRMALTFQRKGKEDDRWTLDDLSSLLGDLGYTVTQADDITQRDIEIGWRLLDDKLSRLEQEYRETLGDEWVKSAHEEFRAEIDRMTRGEYGNARIVAVKP